MTSTKQKINLKGWASLLGLVLSYAAFANSPQAQTVLTINDENISEAEYHRELELLPGPVGIIRSEFTRQPLGAMALEKMIQDRLLFQLAKAKNVLPTQEEVQSLLKERLAANPQLLDRLTKLGYTQKDLEKELRLELAEFKLVTRGVTVTPADVTKYYNDNIKQFTNPKRYKFKIIMVRDEAAKTAVDKDLGEKKSFSEVASKHSVDSSKDNGGSVAPFPADMLPDHMKKVFETLKPDQVSDWAAGNGVHVKFLLEETLPESKQPLDAELQKELQRKLMIERGRAKNNVGKEIQELGKTSSITYKGTLFSNELAQYIEALKAPAEPAASPVQAPSQPSKESAKTQTPTQTKNKK